MKGYEVGGEYVVVEPKELEEIAPGRSRAVDIAGFVNLSDVPPVFFDKTYYLGPNGKEYDKVYQLLEQALSKANRAGIATFVMRQHEYLVAVKAEEGIFALHTLHWADEIRDPAAEVDSLPKRASAAPKELKMAEQLIDALAMDWDPDAFHDTYQEKVAAMIEAKQASRRVEKAAKPKASTNVVDLMEALRASVDQARSPKRSNGKAQSEAVARRSKPTPTPKKRARSASRGASRELEGMTKAELYKKASAAGVSGRSSMSRDELLESLT